MSGVVPFKDHHKVIYTSDGSEGLYNGPSSATNRLCPDVGHVDLLLTQQTCICTKYDRFWYSSPGTPP